MLSPLAPEELQAREAERLNAARLQLMHWWVLNDRDIVAPRKLALCSVCPAGMRLVCWTASNGGKATCCSSCPIPASSGKTTRYRLNRGGSRRANAALYRVVIVGMRGHQPTLDYVRRRTAEGKSKPEIIRCLKRFVAREIFGYLCRPADIRNTASAGS
jgi:hypothetical protein